MTQTVDVEKHHYSEYLQKADEFFQGLKEAVQASRWNAVGLNAVHCVISSSDALTVYHFQKRSTSGRHQDAAHMINKLPVSGAAEKTKQFLDVLNLKNRIEYEHCLTSEKQALQMAKQAERFYSWAKANVPRQPMV